MAKHEKKPTEADEAGTSNTGRYIIGAVVAAAIVAGVIYWRVDATPDPNAPKGDPDVAALMAPGPLEDIPLGSADAPNTVVEYASMTCPHCAHFETEVFPEFKKKYIDTGKVKFIFREFPLDGLAVAASMLARCSDKARFYPMIEGLFETQETWAVPGEDGKRSSCSSPSRRASRKTRSTKCLADKKLFDDIVEVRRKAHEEFGVDSTPSFFINGKRMKGGHELTDFDAVLEGGGGEESPPSG
ncbi:MAG: thioredoxin domain-containing protein [Hyphomicrobiales bacterium]